MMIDELIIKEAEVAISILESKLWSYRNMFGGEPHCTLCNGPTGWMAHKEECPFYSLYKLLDELVRQAEKTAEQNTLAIVEQPETAIDQALNVIVDCEACNGWGKVGLRMDRCPKCYGRGYYIDRDLMAKWRKKANEE